jgi:hypothetical protein
MTQDTAVVSDSADSREAGGSSKGCLAWILLPGQLETAAQSTER